MTVRLAWHDVPQGLTSATFPVTGGELASTGGCLETGSGGRSYLLRWQAAARRVNEILPWDTTALGNLCAAYGLRDLPEPAAQRMVGYRAGEREIGYDTIAGLYNVEGARLRALTSLLQGRLKLSVDQPWKLASSRDFGNPNRRIRTIGS